MLRYEEAIKILKMNHVRDAFDIIAMSDCDHNCNHCREKVIDIPVMCIRSVALIMENYYIKEDRENDKIL